MGVFARGCSLRRFSSRPLRQPRCAPYSVLRNRHVENVTVTCGSSGSITLNIHNAPSPASSSPSPLIIYLPPPPTTTIKSHSPPSALLSDTTCLVQINFRWSSANPFPSPIHDALFAYDWILSNLIPRLNLPVSPRAPPLPVAIYGSSLGGTIATSLALSESRKGLNQRSRIAALAVHNSIFDWSPIVSALSPSSEPPTSGETTQEEREFSTLLPKLFPRPAIAFDPFASPILFFRTSGLAIPSSWPTSTPIESSTISSPSTPQKPLSEPPPWADLEFDPEFDPPSFSPETLPPQPESAPATRKSHLWFPAKNSGLVLPRTLIGVGGSSNVPEEILDDQARELMTLMRRSVKMHEMKGNEDADAEDEAQRRVGVVEVGEQDTDAQWARQFFEDVDVMT